MLHAHLAAGRSDPLPLCWTCSDVVHSRGTVSSFALQCTATALHLSLNYGPLMQISDKIDPSDLVSMIAAFNPDNTPGRLAVVVRMGAANVRSHLPRLVEAVQRSGQVCRTTLSTPSRVRAQSRPTAASAAARHQHLFADPSNV